jgi:hypothetical protein
MEPSGLITSDCLNCARVGFHSHRITRRAALHFEIDFQGLIDLQFALGGSLGCKSLVCHRHRVVANGQSENLIETGRIGSCFAEI